MNRGEQGGAWLGGRATGTYLTLGLQLAIAVTLFFFLGRWADEKFDSAPWGMLTGLAVGMVGGFIKFFRTAITLGREADREAHKGNPDAP